MKARNRWLRQHAALCGRACSEVEPFNRLAQLWFPCAPSARGSAVAARTHIVHAAVNALRALLHLVGCCRLPPSWVLKGVLGILLGVATVAAVAGGGRGQAIEGFILCTAPGGWTGGVRLRVWVCTQRECPTGNAATSIWGCILHAWGGGVGQGAARRGQTPTLCAGGQRHLGRHQRRCQAEQCTPAIGLDCICCGVHSMRHHGGHAGPLLGPSTRCECGWRQPCTALSRSHHRSRQQLG